MQPASAARWLLTLLLWPGIPTFLPFTSSAAPIRVLIVSGQNNHAWAETTPGLREILTQTGGFQVDVTDHPEQCTAASLQPYDVLLSNWNTFVDLNDPKTVKAWPAATRQAYLDFVRGGKGHVVVHAGASSFYDWPEYHALTLGSWKLGTTQHGPPHRFPVRLASPHHPIMAGLREFETEDELWVRPGIHPNAEVLASAFSSAQHPAGSGAQEPVAVAAGFGRGRSFTLLLGHEPRFMANAGFQALLRRGVEWAATGFVTPAPPPSLTDPAPRLWRKDADSVALLQKGEVVWQFNYGPRHPKPCFHPVRVPGGPVLTWFQPADHRWHRALWFSWKFINGINYWEEDPQTGTSAGLTELGDVQIETRPDFTARIVLALRYRPSAANTPVLTERRVIEVSTPAADGAYTLDWHGEFTAGREPVVLDRTPLPTEPDGKPYGGYAGLSVRFTSDLTEPQAVTTAGPVTFSGGRYRGQSAALDYSGLIQGQPYGIAILDHPNNLNAPSPWYVINDGPMRYFSPAVLCYQPHTLKPEAKLTLRYRVFVHPGRWDATRLETLK